MKWINVKDKLPEIPKGKYSITLLVVLENEYKKINPNHKLIPEALQFSKGKFIDLENNSIDIDKLVTHWKYFPKPPKPPKKRIISEDIRFKNKESKK